MQTQRIQNIDRVIGLLEEHRYASIPTFQKIVSLELGITEKKAMEYIELLAFHKKINMENGYAFSLNYKGATPGSDEFFKEKATHKSAPPIPEHERADVDVILEGKPVAKPEHKHVGVIFDCSVCGKQICTACASTYILTEKGTEGKCRGCG